MKFLHNYEQTHVCQHRILLNFLDDINEFLMLHEALNEILGVFERSTGKI
jgi:hypothetical protein